MRISDWSSDVCSSDLSRGSDLSRHRRWNGTMAGTEPRVLGSVAQHHAEGRVAGGCRRVEGRSRQVPALLQPQAGIRALNVVATPRPLSGIRAVRLAPGQAAELRGRTDSTIADAHHIIPQPGL